jgi:predicted HTH domain antitoxin
MEHAVVRIELPEAPIRALGLRDRDIADEVRRALAVELFREGKLSLGKARELAGLSDKWEMLRLLDSRGVAIDYRADDALEDVEAIDRLDR